MTSRRKIPNVVELTSEQTHLFKSYFSKMVPFQNSFKSNQNSILHRNKKGTGSTRQKSGTGKMRSATARVAARAEEETNENTEKIDYQHQSKIEVRMHHKPSSGNLTFYVVRYDIIIISYFCFAIIMIRTQLMQ